MLKMIPFKTINERDLRGRLFLAASDHLQDTGVYFHEDLLLDQIHLLVDDAFNKFKDFIDVAEKKGVLKKKGEMLIKDRSKFISAFDFHRIRIDNPIAVMANEVEPLIPLQRRIRRLAWLPGFWIRKKIVGALMKKAVDEFEQDYKT
ncbi:MAG TPA: glycerol acyltransferase, partial [Desulfobacteraceae bacterium]|nr:glycerol acyltransferase [Desulfobacteraceae bacterium]